MEDKYEITREKATEAVVFICSTLDRHLSCKSITAPVCWFTKGYSLDIATTRKILEHVLNACFKAGIHIPAVSFDGQWHAIAVRDAGGKKPLTKLQLQKDVWRETENLKKQSILNEIKNTNKDPKWEKNNAVIVAYKRSRMDLPTISERVIRQRQKDRRNQQKNTYISAPESPVAGKSNEAEASVDMPTEYCATTTETSKTFVIDEKNATVLLTMLQTDSNSNKKHTWNLKTPDDILACFKSPDTVRKLRDVDLKVVVRFLKKNLQEKMRESDSKADKVARILNLLGFGDNQIKAKVATKMKKQRRETPKSLKTMAYLEVSKLRKIDLNIIYAEFLWPSRLLEWQKTAFMPKTRLYQEETSTEEEGSEACLETKDTEDNEHTTMRNIGIESPCENIDIDSSADQNKQNNDSDTCYHKSTAKYRNNDVGNLNPFTEFFYIPSYSAERDQYEVSCIDSSHLLTRTRRKCCKGGLDGCFNIAWKKVAKSGKTNLSSAMLECILDQMSVSTALSHFSESVEKEMRVNGDTREADLCRDIRMWWKAEDDPGICARERVKMRLPLRKRLMSHVEFGHFPPPGMFVKGWPIQLFEALLASIDAKTLLYSLSKQGTYNNRAFSSLVGETFFSEVTLYDRRGQGTVSAAEFEDFMGTAVEKLHMRLDHKR